MAMIHPMTVDDVWRDIVVVSAKDCRVTTADGRSLLDGLGGLQNVNVGYGRDEIVDAATTVMRELCFAHIYHGRSHPWAELLTARLAEITQPGVEHFTYGVGGSDAVDAAVKFARRYHFLRGNAAKHSVIARVGGYHGATIGGTSFTGNAVTRATYGADAPTIFVGQPHDIGAVAEMEEAILAHGPETIAAILAEPVSFSAGIIVPPDQYWAGVRDLCDRYDILLIHDEVLTGFGRTGRMFAAEYWGVPADLVVLSKGMTSGYFPMSAVGMTSDVYRVVAENGTVAHGFTAGAHPVGCAVALANIEIYQRENLAARAERAGGLLLKQLRPLVDNTPQIVDLRGIGLMTAVDIDPSASFNGSDAAAAMLKRGLIVRSFPNSFLFAPPLTLTDADIDEIARVVRDALAELVSR